jgi:transketolase
MAASDVTTNDWRTKSASQTRLAFGQALLELAEKDPDVVALSSDTQDLLGIREYIEHYPDRFVEVGIAEQNTIGIAAGMATVGLKPYVCGYAPFVTARSLEQVRNDVAYAHQKVVIGAAASGISLGVSGGTHHAIEDLATMRSFSGMTVIVPADVDETYKATIASLDVDGPVYIRLGGRVPEASVTDPNAPFTLGKATEMRSGKDVTVIAIGCMVDMAVKAADTLKGEGINVRVLNMSTVKPLDTDAILKAASETKGIVTAEEHHLAGGLGGAVAEFLVQTQPTPMRLVGMPDEFAVVGPTPPLRAKYGMSADHIAAACRDLLGAK